MHRRLAHPIKSVIGNQHVVDAQHPFEPVLQGLDFEIFPRGSALPRVVQHAAVSALEAPEVGHRAPEGAALDECAHVGDVVGVEEGQGRHRGGKGMLERDVVELCASKRFQTWEKKKNKESD